MQPRLLLSLGTSALCAVSVGAYAQGSSTAAISASGTMSNMSFHVLQGSATIDTSPSSMPSGSMWISEDYWDKGQIIDIEQRTDTLSHVGIFPTGARELGSKDGVIRINVNDATSLTASVSMTGEQVNQELAQAIEHRLIFNKDSSAEVNPNIDWRIRSPIFNINIAPKSSITIEGDYNVSTGYDLRKFDTALLKSFSDKADDFDVINVGAGASANIEFNQFFESDSSYRFNNVSVDLNVFKPAAWGNEALFRVDKSGIHDYSESSSRSEHFVMTVTNSGDQNYSGYINYKVQASVYQAVTSIPEPSTLSFSGLGLLMGGMLVKKKSFGSEASLHKA